MKKYFIFLLMLSIVVTSSGCGGGGGSNKHSEPPEQHYEEPAPTPRPEPTPEPIPDPQPSPEPVPQPQPTPNPIEEPEIPEDNPIPEPVKVRGVEDIIRDKEDIVDNPEWIDLTSYAAINSTISSDLITLAKSRPEVTAENHPRWTGFILGEGTDIFNWMDDAQMSDTLDDIEMIAGWGFNATRIMWGFYTTTFFNDLEASKVNLKVLKYLDRIIEVAIKNDMHIDFTFTNWPGFWNGSWGDYDGIPEGWEPYKSYGEFDLWINPQRKARCVEMLKMIAKRYKDVPSRNFSIYIMFEPGNNSRSTNLPVPEGITNVTIGQTLELFVQSVREVDPNRLIIFEAGSDTSFPDPFESQFYGTEAIDTIREIQNYVMGKYGNLIYQYNFCANPVAFHGMNANVNGEDEYQNIDGNNTTSTIPQYPVTFYGVFDFYSNETQPTKITGFIPDGTKIRIPLKGAWGGNLVVKANGNTIYEELLDMGVEYNYRDDRIGFLTTIYPSEKTVEVELPNNTTEVTIECDNEGTFGIGGLYIVYPMTYAVNKWYYKTTFSAYMEGDQDSAGVFQELTNIVKIPVSYNNLNLDYTKDTTFGTRANDIHLNSDLTFTTNYPVARYDRDWMMHAGDTIYAVHNNNNVALRIECADFQSMEWNTMLRYYKDFYDMCEQQGFNVFINDWYLVQNPFQFCESTIVNQPATMKYRQFKQFNMPLLNFIRENLLHK